MNMMLIPQAYYRRACSIFLATAVLISTPITPSAVTPAIAAISLAPGRSSEPVPGNLFGIHIHRAGTTVPWPSNPTFGTWRLWDSFTQWRQLEPQKGLWQFSKLDSYLAMAESSGVEILLPLGLTPTWASARPAEKSMYGPGHAAEPANMEDWRSYVRTVVTRYKGRIKYYELWNEPNLKTFFSGSTDTMLELTKEAAIIIREVDPGAQIVAPSPTGTTGVAWLNRFLAKGGGNYVDVIGYHFYVTPKIPEKMQPIIKQVIKVRNKYGLQNKPLWNTETGWTFPTALTLSEDGLAAYVARSFVISWAYGVDRFYWYSWDSAKNGLVEVAGAVKTPAAVAYDTIVDWMKGSTMNSFRRTGNGIFVAEISRENGYHGWIVWRASGKAKLKLPTLWEAKRVRTLSGTTDYIEGLASYSVGSSPILIENIE